MQTMDVASCEMMVGDVENWQIEKKSDLMKTIFGDGDEDEQLPPCHFDNAEQKTSSPRGESVDGLEAESPSERNKSKVVKKGKTGKRANKRTDNECVKAGKQEMRKIKPPSDFDLMMERKKAERKSKRKRSNSDDDDEKQQTVQALIDKVTASVRADRDSNREKRLTIRVLSMLPQVRQNLLRIDLRSSMINGGMLSTLTEMLSPLPDNSLPCLQIREELLKMLVYHLADVSAEALEQSGLAKAVMYLYKHPRETASNRKLAGTVIDRWAGVIFKKHESLPMPSGKCRQNEEDREKEAEHDPQPTPKRRRTATVADIEFADKQNHTSAEAKENKPANSYRVTMPEPSTKEYIIRPKWNVTQAPAGQQSSEKKAPQWQQNLKKWRKRFNDVSRPASAIRPSVDGRKIL